MAIDASRVGDRCTRDGDHSILGWRSRNQGWQSIHPGIEIGASRDSDRYIQGRQSQHTWMASTIAASRDGIRGCRSQHPWMAIKDGIQCTGLAIDASRDGDRCTRDDDCSIPGWRSFPPGMMIDASQDGDRCIRGWRSIQHGMASQPSRMAIDASLDGDRCIPGW